MRVVFLAIGDELLRGESRESNGAALAWQLTQLGLQLASMAVVGDSRVAIAKAIADAGREGPVALIISGGLGPTDDDFSRDAIALALDVPLVHSVQAMEQIERRFARFGRTMHPSNERQAWIPQGARLVENRHGTAPGFACQHRGTVVLALPGVPREFSAMLADFLSEFVTSAGLVPQSREEVTLRLFGIAEGDMQGVLHGLPHYTAAQMRSLPQWPEIRLKLARAGDQTAYAALLAEVQAHLGRHIYGQGDADSHAAAVLRALQARQATLAVAESCTGGLLASLLTDVPGASQSLLLGVVAYANDAKLQVLDVDPALLQAHRAVSLEVAAAMAQGARRRSGADVAVATSGIAGPQGGSDDKPIGTLCLAVADGSGVWPERVQLPGLDRQRFKVLAAHMALDRVRAWAQRS